MISLTAHSFNYITQTFLPPLKEFYLNIKNAIGELQSNKNMTLIVDDLSVLSTMGYSISELSSFPQYLRQLVGPSGLVIIATNKGISSENNRLSANLAILADFIITVEPLKTGYCKEITGQVIINLLHIYIYIYIYLHDHI